MDDSAGDGHASRKEHAHVHDQHPPDDHFDALGHIGLFGALMMHFRYSSALLPKSLERPGPKSVSPATNCSGAC